MIVTELYDGQGLGNQLWVYCACRSIADQLGYPFSILSPEKFKAADFLDLDFGVTNQEWGSGSDPLRPFTCAPPFHLFRERMFFDPDLDYVASAFDESVCSLPPGTKSKAFFRAKDFFGHLERCSAYIGIKAEALAMSPVPAGTCVMNIRGGDTSGHTRLVLPLAYWVDGMRNMREVAGVDRFIIVTDDPPYAKALFPGIPVLEGGIAESLYGPLFCRFPDPV